MRRLVKSWSDKEPFKRRVKWYADVDDEHQDIRLVFDDEEGQARVHYGSNVDRATADWRDFKNGATGSIALRRREYARSGV